MPRHPARLINLFGGAGVGKSVVRADLFSFLKKRHFETEEAPEYAKDLVWAGMPLDNQLEILSEQYKRILRVARTNEFVICDSPLLLSIAYRNELTPKHLEPLALELYHEFDNVNIFLKRSSHIPYNPKGRMQNLEGAQEYDQIIQTLLDYQKIHYHVVTAGDFAVPQILKLILENT